MAEKPEAQQRDLTQVRTHFGYDWHVGEIVNYHQPLRTKGLTEEHTAEISSFPHALPQSDYKALAKIKLISKEGSQVKRMHPEFHEGETASSEK